MRHGLPRMAWYLYCYAYLETYTSRTQRTKVGQMVTPSEEKNHPNSPRLGETGSILRLQEYKRCRIRATSYQVGPMEWAPEACFWKYTEYGWRQFWVKSFEHLFSRKGLTFANQRDADFHAFQLARTLIDTILGELEKPAPKSKFSWATYLARLLRTS